MFKCNRCSQAGKYTIKLNNSPLQHLIRGGVQNTEKQSNGQKYLDILQLFTYVIKNYWRITWVRWHKTIYNKEDDKSFKTCIGSVCLLKVFTSLYALIVILDV